MRRHRLRRGETLGRRRARLQLLGIAAPGDQVGAERGIVRVQVVPPAADLAAGRADVNLARSRLNAAWAAFADRGIELPEVCRHLGEAARANRLSDVDLEFASRVLAGELALPRGQ